MWVSKPKNGLALVRGSGSTLTRTRNRDGGMGGCVIAELVTLKGWLRRETLRAAIAGQVLKIGSMIPTSWKE
jgi:hypothetical protein